MAKILVDFDSTLTRFEEAMIETVNAQFGTSYTRDDNVEWNWLATFPQAVYAWGEECFYSREWTLAIGEQPGAKKAIRELIFAGHEPYVVSDRDPVMAGWLLAWLSQRGFGELPVIVSNRNTYPKTRVADELGLKYAVEDAPHNALALAEMGVEVFLLDKPYNGDVSHELITRVDDWPATVTAIKRAAAGVVGVAR